MTETYILVDRPARFMNYEVFMKSIMNHVLSFIFAWRLDAAILNHFCPLAEPDLWPFIFPFSINHTFFSPATMTFLLHDTDNWRDPRAHRNMVLR